MKKILPVAVLSAMACVNGAQAVHVNPDGHGQVLLYPFYTVEDGQDTYINIVNTTDKVKAVKVRFRESLNSQDARDFNLYLSPQDHWSAVVTQSETTGAAVFRSADTSCTVPIGVSQGDTVEFTNLLFADDSVGGLDRTREGYVEVIEMGIVTDATLAAAATHSAGTPVNCAALETAWSDGGVWKDATDMLDPPEGGLYGYGVLINVAEGTDATYDAVALDNFADSEIHAEPGTSLPNLNSGGTTADVIDGNTVYAMGDADSIDNVSAVLMQASIANDYVLEPSIEAGTDWVITFPTKQTYVDGGVAEAPFTTAWSSETSTACEVIGLGYWDREEDFIQPDPEGPDYSPAPPPEVPDAFVLCAEANILTFNDSNVLSGSDRGTSHNLDVNFDNGWMSVSFLADDASRTLVMDSGDELDGLPVIGFAVQKYVNGDVGGILSNYAGSVTHKGTRSIAGTGP